MITNTQPASMLGARFGVQFILHFAKCVDLVWQAAQICSGASASRCSHGSQSYKGAA